jgi:uncharacterized RDD family membrane protein YckC
MNCPNHPELPAGLQCDRCGKSYCVECMVILGREKLCRDCRNAAMEPASAPAARTVQSAENQTAGQMARLGAAAFDGILVMFFAAGLSFAFSFLVAKPYEDWVSITIFSYLGLRFIYEWQMLAATGQTLGKRFWNIKVVAANGMPLGSLAFLRTLARAVFGFIPVVGIVDLLFISSERGRTLHDRVAGTLVVKAK